MLQPNSRRAFILAGIPAPNGGSPRIILKLGSSTVTPSDWFLEGKTDIWKLDMLIITIIDLNYRQGRWKYLWLCHTWRNTRNYQLDDFYTFDKKVSEVREAYSFEVLEEYNSIFLIFLNEKRFQIHFWPTLGVTFAMVVTQPLNQSKFWARQRVRLNKIDLQ